MISSIVSRLVILVFGTLYPAYASYKAVRTKNVKEYVKWMMYWIVFALFTCAETFTDVFFSFWFPFYYEIKIILVLWLLSPATKGSSILYRRFVHPALSRREAEIDDALARATEQGYTAVLHLGTRGVNYATTVLMQTAIKNFPTAVPTKNPQCTLPASQSDSAISSLANQRTKPSTTKEETTRVDGPNEQRGASRRRTRSEDTELPSQPGDSPDVDSAPTDSHVTFQQSSEDEGSSNEDQDLNHQCVEEEIDLMICEEAPPVEFKVPKQKPKKALDKKRGNAKLRGRKATLRYFDPEFSDDPDNKT